ncbi:MAG: elongation factor P 5-aminopentanone reductase [Christensenellales bacterium]|jgi:3-oxoacyl-[acyl-carrier protein] reductase
MNRTVLISGASRGIGRETALRFAAAGYNVAINYINSTALAKDLAQSISQEGGRALAVRADVAKRDEVENMVREIIECFGGIDVLINNAAVSYQQLFTDITLEQWNRVMEVNITGAFNCCQCVLPYMISRKAGCIVNVSSVWGITGASCETHYSASKAALIGLTKALAKELGPSGIRVNCVAPGVIDTDMNACLDDECMDELCHQIPLGKTGSPRDAAESILFLASDAASYITGQVLSPNGGFVI